MSKQIIKKPTAEEMRLEELNKLNVLQTKLAISQAIESIEAFERLKKQAKGELVIKEKVITKDGEQVEIEKKPSQRIVLDANSKIIEWAMPVKTQKHEHTGMIGFGVYNLSELQLDKIIENALKKDNAIEIEAEVVDETQDKPE